MDEDDPAIARSLEAKRADRTALVDGGAIAVGLCVAIVAIGVAIVGPLPDWFLYGFTTASLLAGAALAGAFAPVGRFAGAYHGLFVVGATAALMAAVAVSMHAGGSPIDRVPLVSLVEALGAMRLAGVLVVASIAGALAGQAGALARAARGG